MGDCPDRVQIGEAYWGTRMRASASRLPMNIVAAGAYRDLIDEASAFAFAYLPCIEHALTDAAGLGLGDVIGSRTATTGLDILVSATQLLTTGEQVIGTRVELYASVCTRETYLDYWRDYGDNPGQLRRYGETVATEDVGVICIYDKDAVRAYAIFFFSDAENSLISSAAAAYAAISDSEVDDTGGGGGARAEVYMRMAGVVAVAHSLVYALVVIAADGLERGTAMSDSVLSPSEYAKQFHFAGKTVADAELHPELDWNPEGVAEYGAAYPHRDAVLQPFLTAFYYLLETYPTIYDLPIVGRKLANYWLHAVVASEWWEGIGTFQPDAYVGYDEAVELRFWIRINSQEVGRRLACKPALDARSKGVEKRLSSFPASDDSWLGWKDWDSERLDDPRY